MPDVGVGVGEVADPRVGEARAVSVSRARRCWGRLLGLTAVGCGLRYFWWRVGTWPRTSGLGRGFLAVELLCYVSLLLTVLLLWRIRTRDVTAVPPPSGTLDVYVTVCGEPPEMVERTLRAALAISYPHTTYVLNDGRIAGRDNWAEIDALARRLGVECFTRAEGARGKAANLNHALARTAGDAILTLDADHLADADAAHRTVGYLDDPRVAFVATTQRFELERGDPLNNAEQIFYRAMQPAKDADGCAFSCGNATVYRRAALSDIGGFSEWNLVEDLHTSYQLHAAGWRSVYHPQPITIGTAPSTAAVYASQRLRWAVDSLRILLLDNPLAKRGLGLRQRLHYLHTTSSYLLAAVQVLFLAGPPLSVFLGVQVLYTRSQRDYVSHAVPYLLAGFLYLTAYGGFAGALRALQSSLFNAPLYVTATVRAALGRRRESGTTEKGRAPGFSLLLLPQALAFGVLAATVAAVALDRDGTRSPIAMAWAGLLAFLLLGPLAAVTRTPRGAAVLRATGQLAVVGSVAAVLAFTPPAGSPGGGVTATSTVAAARFVVPAATADAPPPAAVQRLAAPARGAYVGASAPTLLDTGGVQRWRAGSGNLQIVHWFQQWGSGDVRFRADWLNRVAAQGAVPMISWEPWAKPAGGFADPAQPAARLSVIANGRYDAYIRAWAEAAADYKRPMLIRFMHEMNGTWYPWSVNINGNTPAAYVAAWRHVHDIFTAAGATNVSWVWSIGALIGVDPHAANLSAYYPGDAYVDWVAVSGLNWGTTMPWSAWATPTPIFDGAYRQLVDFHKPIMISEIGTVAQGGDSGAWVRSGVRDVATRFPAVKAMVWFSQPYEGSADFRLTGTQRAALRDSLGGGSSAGSAGSPGYWSSPPRIVAAPAARAPAEAAGPAGPAGRVGSGPGAARLDGQPIAQPAVPVGARPGG